MRKEVIKADTIDVAVEGILGELNSSRENVIYFDGWDGLGASAVLQAVAKRLAISNEPATRPTGLEFEEIIQIDCSKWESKRAMQREIAEQLKLPSWVMEMFDKQDEEDDFDGLAQGSRHEIAQVAREISQTVQNRRFLVILHNGSDLEIDILNFGLPLYGYANNKMLWTFRGRFRLDPRMIGNVEKSTTTGVLLSASGDERDPQELWSYLVRHEAAHVSCSKHAHGIIDPATAAECVLYMLKRCCAVSQILDYDWGIHTSNYWICDGIIALTDIDKAWQFGDVLQREVRLLNVDGELINDESTIVPSSHLTRSATDTQHWISTATCGFVLSPSGVIPDDVFRHSHRLGVLKLSRCTFSFSSPPFLCCNSLRFLWLDHCQDLLTTDHHDTDADKEEETSWECFQSLWVLDLRYTDLDQILSARVMDLMTQLRELNVEGAKNWDMSLLWGRLCNIRKLRVINSTCCFDSDVFSEMENMELLYFSGNDITRRTRRLSGPARSSGLKTVVINDLDMLVGIYLRGCKELEYLFLDGSLGSLKELDVSGARVKSLDLTGVVGLDLRRLILRGCEKLRAILWPHSYWLGQLFRLQIDTTPTSASVYGGEAPHGNQSLQKQKEGKFSNWQISLTDARLLRSFSPVRDFLYEKISIHIDMCPAATLGGSNVQGTSSDKLVQVQLHTSTMVDSKYRDVLKDDLVAAAMTMWDCPEIPLPAGLPAMTCIIKIIMHEIPLPAGCAQSASTSCPSLPDFICDTATSLHVYDNSITSIPPPPEGSRWSGLRWCRVERCPKLHTVFTIPPGRYGNISLETFWASQLVTARYIGNWSTVNNLPFGGLEFLHLDYCPRLIHVFPLHIDTHVFRALETLEIVCCGDLRDVFPLSPEHQEEDNFTVFPSLRGIHLHELPKLQRICGRRMYAPHLETIKIRGCWSLRRLPATGQDTIPPKVDCEKEWWDSLEWDGLEKNHHPSLYQTSHSLYYKKAQLPRGTILR